MPASGLPRLDATTLVRDGTVDDLRDALMSGLSVNDDLTPRGPMLIWAAEWGRTDMIEVLLKYGAQHEPLALVVASSKHKHQAARLLLKEGWDPNASVAGWTPLLAAADHLDLEMVELLLDAGADRSAVTRCPAQPQWHNRTAAELARQRAGTEAKAAEILLLLAADP